MKKIILCVSLLLVSIDLFGAISLKSFRERPKLVVVIVIDQFRADYLTRFENRFLPAMSGSRLGGFNYLLAHSAYFPFARYDILQNMTCPGHAMILTGSYPYMNGVSMNQWFDRGAGKNHYCVEDAEFGVSPRILIGTTVSDEYKMSGRKAKVVSIALKDRAAILLGGHRADAVFWMAPDFKWVTSKYYMNEVPDWVLKLNKNLSLKKGQAYTYKADGVGSGLSEIDTDFSYSTSIGAKDSMGYPLGLDLTSEMAIEALHEYKLGLNSSAADFLTISFSSHDTLGHDTSVNHRQMEELVVAEDIAISKLINAVRAQMKSKFNDVTFVLTGDHGVEPNSDYLKNAKIDAGDFNSEKTRKDINQKLAAKYGVDELVVKVQLLNFYLNASAITTKKLSFREVEEAVKAELLKIQGVAYVFSKSDYFAKNLPPGQFEKQILKTYNPTENGDLVLIPKVYFTEGGHSANHLSGYNYDRTVPLLISSKNIKSGVYPASAEMIDLAPTLSFLLGVLPPALSEGKVLSEAF